MYNSYQKAQDLLHRPQSNRVLTPFTLQTSWLSKAFSMTFSSFFMTLGLAVTFENFQNYPCFRVIQLKRHKLQCLPKCVSFALFNYSPLSYVVVLALTFALTNLREVFFKFSMTFQYQQLNSITFQAWKVKFVNFLTSKFSMTCTIPEWQRKKPIQDPAGSFA